MLEEDVKQAIEIISKTNAKKKVYNLAYGFMEEALQNLKVLPQSSAREKLEILARFIVERKF
ncbi:MAG TPA: hypothetical protein ENF87_02005 [Thermoproteales archaeon]|nr:hypothetical protein [Thermoproteales archaeon]